MNYNSKERDRHTIGGLCLSRRAGSVPEGASIIGMQLIYRINGATQCCHGDGAR